MRVGQEKFLEFLLRKDGVLYSIITPMSLRSSDEFVMQWIFVPENGMVNYILTFQQARGGRTWYNIVQDAKDGIVSRQILLYFIRKTTVTDLPYRQKVELTG